jgi:hypothetical protein
LLSGGVQPVRVVIRALVLRQVDDGRSTVEAGAGVGISAKVASEYLKPAETEFLDKYARLTGDN